MKYQLVELTKNDKELIEQAIDLRYLMQFEVNNSVIEELMENEIVLKDNTLKFIDRHLEDDLYIVGMVDCDRLIAQASLQVFDYYPQWNCLNGKKGYIANVYTKVEYRKQGIQKILIDRLIEIAKEEKLHFVTLSTSNFKAVSLYKMYGFVEDGEKFILNI